MKKISSYFVALMTLIFLNQAHSSDCPVDVYGTNKITPEWVCKTYKKEIESLMQFLKNDNTEHLFKKDIEENDPRIVLVDKLRKNKAFSYVNLAPIIYSSDEVFITIDVVERKSKRFPKFLSHQKDTVLGVDKLLDEWGEYEQVGFKLAFENGDLVNYSKCPAHHCIFGFDAPMLKKYGDLFNQKVPQTKDTLVQVLKYDKDPQKRGAAAYLLAHIKDGNELANILVPQIYDADAHVRNSVLRVLGSLLSTQKIHDFPKDPIIAALDFPNLTDRNKALVVLLSLAQEKENHHYILKNAGHYLITNLRMKQPNLHDSAYNILKLISDKDFSEHDYVSWERWLSEAV